MFISDLYHYFKRNRLKFLHEKHLERLRYFKYGIFFYRRNTYIDNKRKVLGYLHPVIPFVKKFCS
jgi:hypothetical protein